jgi:hypothetical protein
LAAAWEEVAERAICMLFFRSGRGD